MRRLFAPLNHKRLPLVIAFFLLLSLNPYYFWWLNISPLYRILLNTGIPLLFFFSKEKKERGTPIIIYLIATFLYVALGFVMGRASIIGSISASICFLYVFVFFSNRSLLYEVLDQLINILCVLIGLAVIAWVAYLLGRLSPLGVLNSPTIQGLSYTAYPFFIVSNSIYEFDGILRFSGPFSEPGFLGTLVALLLVSKQYNIKDFRLIVLFISGLLTLSLAFYLISAFFGLFYLAVEKRRVVAVLVLVSLVGIFYVATKDDEVLSSTLWERLAWDAESNSISGDNRSNDMVDKYYEEIKGTEAFYFGTSDPNWYQNVAGGESATYKNVICINGFITVALYLLYLIQLGWVNKRNFAGFILFVAVLLMNFYQRSSFYSLPVLFLYCCMAKANRPQTPSKVN